MYCRCLKIQRALNSVVDLVKSPKNTVSTGGVYEELKLSEQLNETLGEVRNEVAHLTNTLEQEQERASYL